MRSPGRLLRDLRFRALRLRAYLFGPWLLRRWIRRGNPLKLVIGASGKGNPGWFPTDEQFLDLTKPAHWQRFFPPSSVEALLAEHVWEHLTAREAHLAARTTFEFLKPGGYLRVAVPDGYHPDPVYREWSRVGGKGPGQVSNDHKIFYTYQTLGALFESVGYRVTLLEYHDEHGQFHRRPWDARDGLIRRSAQFDKRNWPGRLVYTSIILDAVKP